jgi:hypothetical protein
VNTPSGIALLLLVSGCTASSAAELKRETVKGWYEYICEANSRMEERLQVGGRFLWIDEAADRSQRVRGGGIIVEPAGEHNPRHVPDGLIHDWIGAVFIPNARLEDVTAIIRDYNRYKEYYRPIVVESKLIHRDGNEDRASMLLMNKSLLLKTALDSDYQSSYFQVDSRRRYSISCMTRIQEVDGFGEPGEHKLPPDESSGYIWRIYIIARFAERDGGVYVETEAIVLSRDIPLAIRWMLDPIVGRVSYTSLRTVLQRTQDAVSAGVAATLPAATPGSIAPPAATLITSLHGH